MYFTDYTVDGFTFTICSDGIIIPPNLMNEDSPEFFRALKKMMGIYPDLAEVEAFLAYKPLNQIHVAKALQLDWLTKYGFAHEGLTEYIQECQQPKAKSPKKTNKNPGYIYLIQSDHGYKIGYTKNPENRIKTFGVKLPFEVEYLCLIPTSDMISLEQQLHEQFADKRINGEWFNLETSDIEYMQSLAEMDS